MSLTQKKLKMREGTSNNNSNKKKKQGEDILISKISGSDGQDLDQFSISAHSSDSHNVFNEKGKFDHFQVWIFA